MVGAFVIVQLLFGAAVGFLPMVLVYRPYAGAHVDQAALLIGVLLSSLWISGVATYAMNTVTVRIEPGRDGLTIANLLSRRHLDKSQITTACALTGGRGWRYFVFYSAARSVVVSNLAYGDERFARVELWIEEWLHNARPDLVVGRDGNRPGRIGGGYPFRGLSKALPIISCLELLVLMIFEYFGAA